MQFLHSYLSRKGGGACSVYITTFFGNLNESGTIQLSTLMFIYVLMPRDACDLLRNFDELVAQAMVSRDDRVHSQFVGKNLNSDKSI